MSEKISADKTKGNFTIISNAIMWDKTISSKAKATLITMLMLPAGWKYSINGLAAIMPEGRASVENSLKELERAGYLERRQIRDEHGKLKGVDYIIHEEPNDQNTDQPDTDIPDTLGPDAVLHESIPHLFKSFIKDALSGLD